MLPSVKMVMVAVQECLLPRERGTWAENIGPAALSVFPRRLTSRMSQRVNHKAFRSIAPHK